jgi:hypothetical protein
MNQQTLDIEAYVKQFNVCGTDAVLDCQISAQVLYTCYLERFRSEVERDDLECLTEYQYRVHEFLDSLRSLELNELPAILKHLDENNKYLLDVVIMAWCKPNAQNYVSKIIYNNVFKKLINEQQGKLCSLVEHFTMRNFCIETLSKENYVPTECIDYLWYYMREHHINFYFSNPESSAYIKITPVNTESKTVLEIDMMIGIEYIFTMGIGMIKYDRQICFQEALVAYVSNYDNILAATSIPSGSNLINQLRRLITSKKIHIDNLPLIELVNNYK